MDNLKHALQTYTPKQRSGYILMDRIVPPTVPTFFVREGKLIDAKGACELGIYSVFLRYQFISLPTIKIVHSSGDDVVMNEEGGYLLRTKIANIDDGGVAAGVAVLDSLYLVD